MNRTGNVALALSMALIVAAPSLAHAQSQNPPLNPSARAAIHAARCAWAARIVEQGRTTATPAELEELDRGASADHLKDPLLILAGCGAVGGDAIAKGMTQLAHVTDVKQLDALMYVADGWRDGAIFDAALALAKDEGASSQARVFAIRHLIVLARPVMLYSYAGLTVSGTTTRDAQGNETITWGCHGALKSEVASRSGTPLPNGFLERIEQTLSALGTSSTAPEPVRNAAMCLR